MSRVVSWICGQSFADVRCGFRVYVLETMLQFVLSGGFASAQESFILLAQRDRRIVEVPLTVPGVREKGKSRIASNLFRYRYRTSGAGQRRLPERQLYIMRTYLERSE